MPKLTIWIKATMEMGQAEDYAGLDLETWRQAVGLETGIISVIHDGGENLDFTIVETQLDGADPDDLLEEES